VKGLFQEDRGAEICIPIREFVGGDDDDGQLGVAFVEPSEPFPSVHGRHHQVENDQHDVGIFFHERDGFLAVFGHQHFEAVGDEQVAVRGQKLRVVIDDEKLTESLSRFAYVHDDGLNYLTG